MDLLVDLAVAVMNSMAENLLAVPKVAGSEEGFAVLDSAVVVDLLVVLEVVGPVDLLAVPEVVEVYSGMVAVLG